MNRVAFLVLVALVSVGLAPAATFTFFLDTEFSGATPPTGTPPWLTATFTDIAAGTVELELEAVNLSGSEFVSQWLFNLDPNLNPTLLSFVAQAGSTAPTPAPSLGTNAFKADGDGDFDIRFSYSNGTFTAGEIAIYHITFGGAGTFDANSFMFLSAGGGNSPNGLFTAAHVQSIADPSCPATDPTCESGWITGDTNPPQEIPEPSFYGFVGAGLAGLVYLRRRKAQAA